MFGDAGRLFARAWWPLVGTAIPLGAIDLAYAFADRGWDDLSAGSIALIVSVYAVGALGTAWVYGALVAAAADARSAGSPSVLGAYRSVNPLVPALLIAGFVYTIGFLVGTLLLVVPGLVLAVRWGVAFQAIVLEGLPWRAAFARSVSLVRGRGWAVFRVLVLSLLAYFAASLAAFAAFTSVPGILGAWLEYLVPDLVIHPYLAVVWTLLYFRLAEHDRLPA